jgi:hypothetical protein
VARLCISLQAGHRCVNKDVIDGDCMILHRVNSDSQNRQLDTGRNQSQELSKNENWTPGRSGLLGRLTDNVYFNTTSLHTDLGMYWLQGSRSLFILIWGYITPWLFGFSPTLASLLPKSTSRPWFLCLIP